jgi:ABC transporter transmembrane protein
VPVAVANVFYNRTVRRLNACLHDELEKEVGVIHQGDPEAVRGHYHRVCAWRIRLADSEALNVGLVELFVIALLAVTLLRSCSLPGAGAGDIVAVFRYVIVFVTALDTVPVLIQHVSRLRDIGRRMRPDAN